MLKLYVNACVLHQRASIPGGCKGFSFFPDFYTVSGVYSAFCSVDTGGFFSGLKRLERESDHTCHYSAKVKNVSI